MSIKFIQNKLHDIIHVFEHIGLDFFHSLIDSIAQNGGKVLQEAAIAAVAAAEASGGSGKDKFDAALAQVIATLTAQGLPVVQNAVRGAIEAAVADLRTVQIAPAA